MLLDDGNRIIIPWGNFKISTVGSFLGSKPAAAAGLFGKAMAGVSGTNRAEPRRDGARPDRGDTGGPSRRGSTSTTRGKSHQIHIRIFNGFKPIYFPFINCKNVSKRGHIGGTFHRFNGRALSAGLKF